MKQGFVYILASGRNGTLYIGVTSDLNQRAFEHKIKATDGFTRKYKVNQLVYYEHHEEIADAIAREKAMKKWYRSWKIELIESVNPEWKDLSSEIVW